jgi:coenzyme Q-binding protein COQ10
MLVQIARAEGQPMRRTFTRFYPNYSPAELFALIDDIESYPAFVPFCQRTRVLSRDGARRRVENVYGVGRLHLTFVSEARADPPRELVIESCDGVMSAFRLRWIFQPEGEGCRLSGDLLLEFSSHVLNALAPFAAADIENRVMAAFEQRAEHVRTRAGYRR